MNPWSDPSVTTGSVAYSSDGRKVGAVVGVVCDSRSDRPAWLVVDSRPYGPAVTVVPLQGVTHRGQRVVLDFDHETVAGVPRVEVQGDVLRRRDAAELRRYYQLDGDYSSWQPGR